MSGLASIALKLEKLIPRLATDHDGEVVATARAIGRTLAGAGLTYHDLASAITSTPALPPPEPDNWPAVAKWCRANGGGLSAKEREFIGDMVHRLVCGGRPTERQADWLRSIYAKLRKEAAHG